MQKLVGILKSITAPGVYQTNDAGKYVVLEVGTSDSFQGVPFPE